MAVLVVLAVLLVARALKLTVFPLALGTVTVCPARFSTGAWSVTWDIPRLEE